MCGPAGLRVHDIQSAFDILQSATGDCVFVRTIALVVIGLLVLIIAGTLLVNRPTLKVYSAELPADFPPDGFSHRVFEDLLGTYVDDQGNVDYESWQHSKKDVLALDAYLTAVSLYSPDNAPARFPQRNDALAYWIYAYNAYVIRTVLEKWPLESVVDIRAPVELTTGFGFFYRQRYLFGTKAMSLYAAENEKIRSQFKDARIHFVLNCASESCPVMRPGLPTGKALDDLLQAATVEFIADDGNVFIDHAGKKIILNEIFRWFRNDFINDLRLRGISPDGGLIAWITLAASGEKRASLERAADYELAFDQYDWAINKSADKH